MDVDEGITQSSSSSASHDENVSSVLALLMMKDTSSNVNGTENMCQTEAELYIPSVFQPKFMEIHDTFMAQLPAEYRASIPQHDHLLGAILEYMVKFCCWARGSADTSAWINNLLFQNVDFRPELRNGLTMILMYTFAASQAVRSKRSSDLFTVVMDANHGLGIIHKTSLRVYSDPFNFFSFLKLCLTGLIECGVLKENERVSQSVPKTRRRHFEVESELVAFNDLKSLLVTRLRTDLEEVKLNISAIVTCWQEKSLKVGRSRRFGVALQLLSRNNALVSAQTLFPELREVKGGKTVANLELRQSKRVKVGGSMDTSGRGSPHPQPQPHSALAAVSTLVSTNVPPPAVSMKAPAVPAPVPVPVPTLGTPKCDTLSSDVPVPAICSLRCDRVGVTSWEVHESKIVDVGAFFDRPEITRIFAVDFACLTPEELAQQRINIQSKGLVSLESELRHRGAVQTTWGRSEFPQLRGFMETARTLGWRLACLRYLPGSDQPQAQDQAKALCETLRSMPFCCNFFGAATAPGAPSGKRVCLVYECVVQSGYLLRACPELGVTTDAWRMVYKEDVERCALSTDEPSRTGEFIEFLVNIFPQLRAALQKVGMRDSFGVSYSPQFGPSPTAAVSTLAQRGSENVGLHPQCLGALSARSDDILSRYVLLCRYGRGCANLC